jgi:hypothetical protein
LKYNDEQSGWKNKTALTPAECANNGRCYPDQVSVEGVDGLVEPGVHSFTINSLYTYDEFHVAFEGPELSPTFVEAHGSGTYTASSCVELPGFYINFVFASFKSTARNSSAKTFSNPHFLFVCKKMWGELKYFVNVNENRTKWDFRLLLYASLLQ